MSEEVKQRDVAQRGGPERDGAGRAWRRIEIVAGVIAAVVLLFVGIVLLVKRSSRPEVLVAKLRRGAGEEREALVMRLNLARGDTVTPLVDSLRDRDASSDFRSICLDLLFKKNARASDEKIEAVLHEAISDPDPVVRRTAVYGFAVYMDPDDQSALAGLVTDPDPEVRRQVYLLLNAEGRRRRRRRRRRGGSLWRLVSGEAKQKLVADARAQADKETDPELRLLARAVLGRRIEELCDEATRAAQTSDLIRAEELLEEAIGLDRENHQARIRHVRFHLSAGNREKAFALGEEYGALLRIPRLPEAPVVDGDPTDEAWQGAFASDRFCRSTGRWVSPPAEGRSEMRLGHVDGKVFVAILAYEEDLDELVVKYKARDSDVWRDDCVELFFDPTNSEKNVYQFVINAGGACFDMYRRRRQVNVECEYAAKVFPDRGYWGCEFAVAASALDGGSITPESVWGMNVMRTRIGAAAEQDAWWPTFGHSHNYHLFPIAVFEGLDESAAEPSGPW